MLQMREVSIMTLQPSGRPRAIPFPLGRLQTEWVRRQWEGATLENSPLDQCGTLLRHVTRPLSPSWHAAGILLIHTTLHRARMAPGRQYTDIADDYAVILILPCHAMNWYCHDNSHTGTPQEQARPVNSNIVLKTMSFHQHGIFN